MRKLDSRTFLLPLLAAALLLVLGGLARGTKIRERVGEPAHGSSEDSRESGKPGVEVSADNDSSATIVVHPRRHHDRGDSTSIVRIGESVTIAENQTVPGDVVDIGGTVTVLGHVRGDVVSIGGDIDLSSGGVVDGDAVSVGGTVRRGAGSHVGGQNVGMRFVPSGLLGLWHPGGGGHFPFFSFVFAGMKLIFLFLIAWVLALLGETRMRETGRFMVEHLWKSLFVGLAVLILSPAAFFLLLCTIVGIPVALLLPVALMVALLIGYLAVAAMVGLRLIKASDGDRHGWVKASAAGLIFFEGIPFVGHLFRVAGGILHPFGIALIVFGYAAIWISSSIGLGSLVLSRFGQKTEVRHLPPAAPAAQPVTI